MEMSLTSYAVIVVFAFLIEWPGNAVTASPKTNSNTATCGKTYRHQSNNIRRVRPIIFGGETSCTGDWPWQVGLVNATSSDYLDIHCGGSLIHPKWVLTAAHCLTDNVQMTHVMTGHFMTYRTTDKKQQILKVKKRWVHPQYSNERHDDPFDIALVELEGKGARLDKWTNLVCMPRPHEQFRIGERCFTSGFGVTESSTDSSNPNEHLLHTDVKIVSLLECARNYSYEKDNLYEEQICAAEKGKDSCSGDSGGPLVCKMKGSKKNQHVLAGVVSFGQGCAIPGFPTVYIRVTEFLDWIESVTKLPFYDGSYVANPTKQYPTKIPRLVLHAAQ